jgi:hypothetical protein
MPDRRPTTVGGMKLPLMDRLLSRARTSNNSTDGLEWGRLEPSIEWRAIVRTRRRERTDTVVPPSLTPSMRVAPR